MNGLYAGSVAAARGMGGGLLVVVAGAVVVIGIMLRQADRWWFRPHRGGYADSAGALMVVQRRQANNVTPALLLTGHWVELLGWWALAGGMGPVGWMIAASAAAVKFRHLQEVSHFAVHGVLFRGARFGDAVTELTAHAPLGFAPVSVRRHQHVRLHHPNATVTGLDPNLADLQRAGLGPGIGRAAFVRGILFPLTPRGVLDTLRAMVGNLVAHRQAWWRVAVFLVVPVMAFMLGGTNLLVFGFVVGRVLLYPQLAWMSLLVEHSWFTADVVAGSPTQVEAARCVRIYFARPLLEAAARALWLPYGDLYHYAHSVHPAARWNYLPRLEALIGLPACRAPQVVFGRGAVLTRLYAVTVGPRPTAKTTEGHSPLPELLTRSR